MARFANRSVQVAFYWVENLVHSAKSSTFAPAFDKEVDRDQFELVGLRIEETQRKVLVV